MADIKLFNADCMELMNQYDNNAFDIAIVDPPYGINRAGQVETFTKKQKHKRKFYKDKGWDNKTPGCQYWQELKRISKNQIVFGANYFTDYLQPSMGWIYWDKGQKLSMSDGELIFTSFNRALRSVTINRAEILKDGAIHPTQKPVKLYKWILKNYCNPGSKIIDTHLGSGSIAIACFDYDYDLTSCEIDVDYFNQAKKRFENHKSQLKITF